MRITHNSAMSAFPSPRISSDHLANLRRLTAARWAVVALAGLLVAIIPGLLDVALPVVPLLGILGLVALFNGLSQWRIKHSATASQAELLSQLALDIACLSALLFFSGGATNPLISLLLPPVAIAALTLPGRSVIATGVLALVAYSLLMVFYVPLPLADAVRATRLHLLGMWFTFALSALMIGWFVVRMTALIRERDAQLATARENALRDERVLAMGTLAAGAAHELGTPLATMAVIAGELSHDASLSAAAREDLGILRQQIAACKEIISQLARRGGAERLESADAQALDTWLEALRRRWHSLRPDATSRLVLTSPSPAPALLPDPTLEQAVVNLLNNAANAGGSGEIQIAASWDDGQCTIEVRDRGPGFSAQTLDQAGHQPFATHARGSGIGLLLTRSAVERLGGRLHLANHPEGGAVARIELPLDRISP